MRIRKDKVDHEFSFLHSSFLNAKVMPFPNTIKTKCLQHVDYFFTQKKRCYFEKYFSHGKALSFHMMG